MYPNALVNPHFLLGFELGLGIGISSVEVEYKTRSPHSPWPYQIAEDEVNLSKRGLSYLAFAGIEVRFLRYFSIGLQTNVKFIPLMDSLRITGYFIEKIVKPTYPPTIVINSKIYDFPESKINLWAFELGLNLGLHF